MGTRGIACTDLTDKRSLSKGNALNPEEMVGCRANGRVAVVMNLVNPGAEPWTAAGALLRGPKGEVLKPLPLWQSAPILPYKLGVNSQTRGRVVVVEHS